MKRSYWIKKRLNPQLESAYYVACGQLTKKDARRKGRSLYGANIMLEFKTEQEYATALESLKEKGFTVH